LRCRYVRDDATLPSSNLDIATLTKAARTGHPVVESSPPVPRGMIKLTTKDVLEHFQEYQRERPGVVALWCFGIGFVLGWKFKLW
jgi:hypothetical protein